MSGHNKWSKIKHKKAATDAAKSKVFSKHATIIALESKKSGGDITLPNLAAAIERAKKDSMPKENIERAMAKGTGEGGAALEEVLYEAYGPGGTAMLIIAVTSNNNRTAAAIRHVLSRSGCQLGTPGSAAWAFTKKDGGFVPQNPLDLSDEDGEKLGNLIQALDENDDVQDVYTTADNDES